MAKSRRGTACRALMKQGGEECSYILALVGRGNWLAFGKLELPALCRLLVISALL